MGCSALDLLAWFPGTLLREQQKAGATEGTEVHGGSPVGTVLLDAAGKHARRTAAGGATVLGFKWFLRIGVHNAQGSRQGVTSSGDTNHGRASPAGIQ